MIGDAFGGGILAYQLQEFIQATAGYLKNRQRAKGTFLGIISSAWLIARFGLAGYLIAVYLGWRLLLAIKNSGEINSKK